MGRSGRETYDEICHYLTMKEDELDLHGDLKTG